MASLLVPPSSVKGSTRVNPEAFKVTLNGVPRLKLPTHSLNKYRGELKNFLLKMPNFKSVQPDPDSEGKSVVYLDPRKMKDVSQETKKKFPWDESYGEEQLTLSYENWTCEEILRAILPDNVEVPGSYSVVGHIIHVNLREEQLPYKAVIGQVFLDKIPRTKTVVNKLDSIDTKYRNFAMEILAGQSDTVVSMKENGCTFQFDFAKVYWNPRLATEHSTLVNFLKPGDVLYDVFAGVGPFAIPAARKNVQVLANDLNPESYKWLQVNAKINKVSKLLTAFNEDGRDFIQHEVRKHILNRRENGATGSEHMTMNLPALAVEFLDVFPSWLDPEEIKSVASRPPMVHVYCFIKAAKTENHKDLAKKLVEDRLEKKISSESLVNIHHVRNVAPNKEMMRAKMGKNKPKVKNVFKVANNRAQKAKRKAQKVKTTLKKLDLGQGSKLNKEKTNLINKQLAELSKEVYLHGGKKKAQAQKSKVIPIMSTYPVGGPSKEETAKLVENLKI
ncbi:hypothetical protein QAD02_019017 [Eretmocerus hayati]|uniref:Uncharacterized protein n=1 Tax=Eretmocerus hayati TaxID=131215 RepID=A0ACC2PIJ4_9HYME|nr:hypothetical protein QAD02_019017 [Eretmocerus hayati]